MKNKVTPLSYDNFPWESTEIKAAEWNYAKQHLAPNGILLPDGTKLRRKDLEHVNFITHSFIIIDGVILAMAPRGNYLGKGLSAHAKLAEDENGGLWAIKIRKLWEVRTNRCVADRPEIEDNIANDVGKSLKSTIRTSNSSKKEKHYLAYIYLGIPLSKYLTQHKFVDDSERYDLAIKMALAVYNFNSGLDSKTQTRYTHMDLNLGNIIVDERGNVHLIDFGGSRKIPTDKSEYTIEEFYLRYDIDELLRIMEIFIFTEEMQVKGSDLWRVLSRQYTEEESRIVNAWCLNPQGPKPNLLWDTALGIAKELERIKLSYTSREKFKFSSQITKTLFTKNNPTAYVLDDKPNQERLLKP